MLCYSDLNIASKSIQQPRNSLYTQRSLLTQEGILLFSDKRGKKQRIRVKARVFSFLTQMPGSEVYKTMLIHLFLCNLIGIITAFLSATKKIWSLCEMTMAVRFLCSNFLGPFNFVASLIFYQYSISPPPSLPSFIFFLPFFLF